MMICLSHDDTGRKEVNHSSAASFSMLVTSSTPVCSMVASIRLGSDVPVWATSACACRLLVHRVPYVDELLHFLELVRYLCGFRLVQVMRVRTGAVRDVG